MIFFRVIVYLSRSTIGEYLDLAAPTDCMLDDQLLSRYAKILDIVTPDSTRSCCFTKAYSHYYIGEYFSCFHASYCPLTLSSLTAPLNMIPVIVKLAVSTHPPLGGSAGFTFHSTFVFTHLSSHVPLNRQAAGSARHRRSLDGGVTFFPQTKTMYYPAILKS